MTKLSLNGKFLKVKSNEEDFKNFFDHGGHVVKTYIKGETLNIFDEFDKLFQNVDELINLLKLKIFYLTTIIDFYHWLDTTGLNSELKTNLLENKIKFFNCDDYFLDTVLEFHEIYKEEVVKFYNRNLLIHVGACKFFNNFEDLMKSHVDVNEFHDYIGVIELQNLIQNIFVLEDGSIRISNIYKRHNQNYVDDRRIIIHNKKIYTTPLNDYNLLSYGLYNNFQLTNIYLKIKDNNIKDIIFLKEIIIKRPSDDNYPYISRLVKEVINFKDNKYKEFFNEAFRINLTMTEYINTNYGGDNVKSYYLINNYRKLFLNDGIFPSLANFYSRPSDSIFTLFSLEYLVYILNQIITPLNKNRVKIIFDNFETLFLNEELLNIDNKSTVEEVKKYLQKISNFINHGDASMPLEWQLELL